MAERRNPKDLKLHPVHADAGVEQFDVFIAGSGPIGATYARLLVDRGFSVCMVEVGDLQDHQHPGSHQKNEIRYAKDIDKFVRVIQGALETVSIPTSVMNLPTLDPAAWSTTKAISHGSNPHQDPHKNLGAQAVTKCVGGMATHWTCATPEFLKGVERPVIFPDNEKMDDEEWRKLYEAARRLIGTSENEFTHSIRHNTVLQALQNDPRFKNRNPKPLPLACDRIGGEDGMYVRWHSAENIFGPNFFVQDPPAESGRGKFRLLSNTRVTRLYEDYGNPVHEIQIAEVRDLLRAMENKPDVDFSIRAKVFVVAAGAVATPQILANSRFGALRTQLQDKNVLIPNLGMRITEQPMAFCQIVWRKELVDNVTSSKHPDWWRKAVEKQKKDYPNDPLPIPVHDPEPQVTIPLSKEFPWHTQIHRDAFSYGEAGPLVDPRVVVDLRFFGMQDGQPENRMIFEDDCQDIFDMPQATFEYTPTDKYAAQTIDMMNDMCNVAHVLGGYIPGSNPQFMTPGLALHLGGSVRLGHANEKDQSVADYNSRVWNTKNLYVAGNGTIPTPFGANPTLTSMCFAIRSARTIRDYLDMCKQDSARAETFVAKPEVTPTPDEWLKWAFDEKDKNYPRHERLRGLNATVLTV